jgi:hypothetical protein
VWGDREPFVERAALIGLHVRKGDVPQTLDGNDLRYGLADEREHLARAGMKEQGGIISDEVLVKGEARHWRIDTVNAVSDLMEVCARMGICHCHKLLSPEQVSHYDIFWTAQTS